MFIISCYHSEYATYYIFLLCMGYVWNYRKLGLHVSIECTLILNLGEGVILGKVRYVNGNVIRT